MIAIGQGRHQEAVAQAQECGQGLATDQQQATEPGADHQGDQDLTRAESRAREHQRLQEE